MTKWTALVVVAALVLGYGFALVNMKIFEPAMTAQIAGNQQMAANIDQNFARYNQGIQEILARHEAKLAKLEAKNK